MRVLAISGSLRRGSYNTQLLRVAAERAPAGMELELYDELELVPPYNADRDTDEPPAEVRRLRDKIAAADALLFATPEYNSSIPGQLKNAVDWASRPFRHSALWGKPAAVIAASPNAYGGLWAQVELKKVLARSGARVVDVELAIPRVRESFDADGRLVDEALGGRLDAILEELAVATAPPLATAA